MVQVWRTADAMNRANVRNPGTRYLPIIALLYAATTSLACDPRSVVSSSLAAAVLRQPTPRDEFFHVVAANFQVPDLCNRIDARADGSSSGWSTGHHFRTLRSVCVDDSDRSAQSVVMPAMIDQIFVAQVRALGYTDADVLQAAYEENPYLTPIYSTYEQVLKTTDFRQRVHAAPSYQEPRDASRLRPAMPVEFIYQMVAVDTREPALCTKVSPNAFFQDLIGAPALLHSRCYLHLAFEMRDAALCDPLPMTGSFRYINNIYDSREECRKTVAIYRQPTVPASSAKYGPYLFPRAADFRVILQEIGYTPSDLPLPIPVTPDDYWAFVSRLRFRGPEPARAEFLRRVMALK